MQDLNKRETLGSRLGFIFLSAGCAIGLGNVWRFPFITGQYGGAAFVLIYIFFLLFLALPSSNGICCRPCVAKKCESII